ncbi:MAG: hypothetical protein QOI10_144 [Solirubrobacterales bacterium]|jgi:hypothetical protein|nr:hypothetical protein [Solirubrobacterales bacterium]
MSSTIKIRGEACALAALVAVLAFPAAGAAAPPAQLSYVKASNPESDGALFGSTVAISGNTMVIGGPNEDSDATGVNGRMFSDGAPDSGAAYVYVRSGSTWTQQAYLKASNTGASDFFGSSVAISGDTIVVGAPGEDSSATGVNGNQADNTASFSGAAYVFTRSGTTWAQQAYLKASNAAPGDSFGSSVAISGDTVVISAVLEDSNATGVNGNQADNTAADSGAAYVFTRSGSTWAQQAYLKASNTGAADELGYSTAISGDTVVIGAFGEDSSATGVNGNQADNSASNAGAAYVFTRTASAWAQQAYLKASNTGANDVIGPVAISGDTVVIAGWREDSSATGAQGDQTSNGATDSGAAYVFARNGSTWTQQAYLKASNTGASDFFGISVGLSGDTLVIGALGEDSSATGVNGNQADNSASNAGAAYVFTRSGSAWTQQAYLKASNAEATDEFGRVGISGDTIVIGADWEGSSATGVNGNQADNGANKSGAAYVFGFDRDADLLVDDRDNCPDAANPGQENLDADGQGNACDADDDDDGRNDGSDACPLGATGPGDDIDSDGCKSAEDPDDDDDGVLDGADTCPRGVIGPGGDLDGDGCKAAEDADDDGDGVADASDNCPALAAADQSDADSDGAGDACDFDDDNDGVADATDNCRLDPNPGQENADGDARGDACDPDSDNDGIADRDDSCDLVANAGQADVDGDGLGDACDAVDNRPPPPPQPHCVVPKISPGASRGATKHALEEAGCELGKVTKAHSRKVARRKLIKLTQPAGTELDEGAAVDAVFSLGPRSR